MKAGHSLRVHGSADVPFIEIKDGKTKFVVVPYNIPIFDFEHLKKIVIEKLACHRIMRPIQKTAEINNLFGLVGKHKMNFVLTSLPALSKFWRDVLRLPERYSEPVAMTQPNGIVPPLGATGKIPAPLVGKGKLI